MGRAKKWRQTGFLGFILSVTRVVKQFVYVVGCKTRAIYAQQMYEHPQKTKRNTDGKSGTNKEHKICSLAVVLALKPIFHYWLPHPFETDREASTQANMHRQCTRNSVASSKVRSALTPSHCDSRSSASPFLYLFNTTLLRSLNYNNQRLIRRNRRLKLVTNTSEELILTGACRD